ncbi:MAG: mechanosensitive ion channel [Actinobacteria bacterium]|nr:mechanosensitive ion channel [Actinomycetota bacterium]MCA1740193.1 mechanosensitive ion channel [Actinomycetota bacterium]
MYKIVEDLGLALTEFVPRLLGAVVVMIAALIVAMVLQRSVARLLEAVGLDEFAARTGAADSLQQLGYRGGPSRLLGLVLFWGIIITGIAGALSVLGLSSLEQTMSQLVTLAGQALVALVILIAGVTVAGWLADLVARKAENAGLRGPNVFKRIVFVTVVAVSGLVAASQLGLETSFLILLAVILLATVGLVTAIALGQGLVPLSGNIAAGRYVQEGLEVGDEISLDGVEGSVEELGYAAVILRSEDGYLYRIPNRNLLEGVVRKRAE